jgi:hypothetical protein
MWFEIVLSHDSGDRLLTEVAFRFGLHFSFVHTPLTGGACVEAG